MIFKCEKCGEIYSSQFKAGICCVGKVETNHSSFKLREAAFLGDDCIRCENVGDCNNQEYCGGQNEMDD